MLSHMDGRRDRQNIQNILRRHHPSLPPGRFSIHLPDAPQVHIARLAALGLSQGRISLALQPLSLLAGPEGARTAAFCRARASLARSRASMLGAYLFSCQPLRHPSLLL